MKDGANGTDSISTWQARSRAFAESVAALLTAVFLAACSCQPANRIEPLEGFQQKVSALATTTVRSNVRGDSKRQEIADGTGFFA
jgi:hypothetical protein